MESSSFGDAVASTAQTRSLEEVVSCSQVESVQIFLRNFQALLHQSCSIFIGAILSSSAPTPSLEEDQKSMDEAFPLIPQCGIIPLSFPFYARVWNAHPAFHFVSIPPYQPGEFCSVHQWFLTSLLLHIVLSHSLHIVLCASPLKRPSQVVSP